MTTAVDHLRARPIAAALLIVVVAGGAVLRARHLDAPFGDGFRGVNGGAYYGQFEKHYLEHGLAGCRFGLVLQSFPGTTKEMVRDLSHPAVPSWIFHGAVLAYGGRIETGLRLVPLLASSAAIVALFLLARRTLGRPGALATAAVAATSPMWAFYGVMVVAECFLLLAGCLVALATLRYLSGEGSLATLLLVFFAGCLLDWHFYFFAPGAWALALGRRRGPASPWRLLWMLPVGVLAFGLFVLHGAWAAGGLEPLWQRLQETRATAFAAEGFTAGDWLEAVGDQVVTWYGWPLLALAAGGAAVTLTDRLRGTRRDAPPTALFFLVSGGLSVLLFHRHAYDHDFWTMGLAAALYLPAGRFVQWLGRRLWPAGAAFSATLLAALVADGAARTVSAQDLSLTRGPVERAAKLDGLARADDVVLTSEPWYTEVFYARSHVFPHVRSRAQVDLVLESYGRSGSTARVLLLLPERGLDGDPGVRRLAAEARALGLPEHADRGYRIFNLTPGR